jgi:hypothetical protein
MLGDSREWSSIGTIMNLPGKPGTFANGLVKEHGQKSKAELERIQKELVDAHNKAAWQMAATIIKPRWSRTAWTSRPPGRTGGPQRHHHQPAQCEEDALELLKR